MFAFREINGENECCTNFQAGYFSKSVSIYIESRLQSIFQRHYSTQRKYVFIKFILKIRTNNVTERSICAHDQHPVAKLHCNRIMQGSSPYSNIIFEGLKREIYRLYRLLVQKSLLLSLTVLINNFLFNIVCNCLMTFHTFGLKVLNTRITHNYGLNQMLISILDQSNI